MCGVRAFKFMDEVSILANFFGFRFFFLFLVQVFFIVFVVIGFTSMYVAIINLNVLDPNVRHLVVFPVHGG